MKIGYTCLVDEKYISDETIGLKQVGCQLVFVELHIVGRKPFGVELDNVLALMLSGDILVVTQLSRFARSLTHLLTTLHWLAQHEIGFFSISESLDTTVAEPQVVLQLLTALVECQRRVIRERTYVGLAAAKARGSTGGRPPALASKKKEQLYALFDAGELLTAELAVRFGISRSTLYTYLKQR